jgi:peptidoglycan/LPS O-acetylase OafA/YrhL
MAETLSSSAAGAHATRGRIDVLDGLRAISIALVLLGHGAEACPEGPLHRVLSFAGSRLAHLGVSIFFVLSGYLITRLLIVERKRSSTISLRAFYARRVLRIFPALYVYCFVLFLLVLAGRIAIAPSSFVAALTFTWNYGLGGREWWLGHCWSLAVEEQFYLCWPLLLALSGPRRAKQVALGVIAIEPFLRTATYFVFPAQRPLIGDMGHTRIDTILFGCVLALLEEEPAVVARLRKHADWKALAAVAALFLSGLLMGRFRGLWLMPLGHTVEGFSIALIISWAVCAAPANPAVQVLCAKPVTWLGRISYSLYLWQQLFLAREGWRPIPFPWTIIAAIAAAAASYYLVEQPILRMRGRLLPERTKVAAVTA